MAHDGEYTPVEIRNTVDKNTTAYGAEGAWVDANHIRFRDGKIQKWGGWTTFSLNEPFKGVSRDINIFKELDNTTHIAVGTHQKLQIEEGNVVFLSTVLRISTGVYSPSCAI